ncbi:MAG TPA: PAS domain-containing protein, partial [Spirochaetia bacterium]|nr:PAS domain-containing protein [Spirochaetia bacterium]
MGTEGTLFTAAIVTAIVLLIAFALMLFAVYRRLKEAFRQRSAELKEISQQLTAETGKRSVVDQELAERNLRSHQIVESLPVGVLILDARGFVTFVNSVCAKMFDIDPAELVGRHYVTEHMEWEVFQMDGSPLRNQDNPFTVALATEISVMNAEYLFRWRNGRELRVSMNVAPLISVSGEHIGVVASIEDVTNLAETKAELEVQRAFFEQMFLQSAVATQIFDRDGRRLRANSEWCRLFEVDEGDLPNLPYNIFEDPTIVGSGMVPSLHRVLEDGITAEWEILVPNGPAGDSKRWLRIKAHPIWHSNPLITHLVVHYDDISEVKRSQEDMQKSLREKVLLLKEVHHRVKNNMQLMKSMLRLQAGYVSDPHTLSMLTDSASRINAMSL